MNREEILKILSSYDLTEEEKEYLYLQLYFTNQLNSKSDEEILQMHKEQKKNRDSILNEIAKIMLSYSIVESIMSISKSDKLKLQSKINGLINSKIQSELKYETIKTGQLLKYIGENKYNTNNYIDSLGMKADYNLLPVKQDILDKIINTKVDGKFWSDRLWNNKNQTAADLRNEIKKFLKGETTVNQIEDIIKNKYDSNAFNTKRLVVDNIARVQEGMNDVWREDHNIKRVLYLATLCHNTCSNCSQYDGKEYLVDRKPVDLPQHNFCRCTYVNLPYKGWRPSERLDNETKSRVTWQDYEEWVSKFRQTGGKYTIGDVAWNDRREDEAKDYYDLIRDRNDDIKMISKNVGFSEKMIAQIKNHVFYNDKHVLFDGIRQLDPDYDMSVAWQRLINGDFKDRDILLLRHEYLESGIEKRYNLTNKQAHDITIKKYDWHKKLESEKGEFGEDDCLTKIIGKK